MEEKDLEPVGTIPTIGDRVVCFGASNYRVIGKPYEVIRENEYDVFTAGDGKEECAWEKLRFEKTEPRPAVYRERLGCMDNPRWYRVLKRDIPR